jgi:hypothetical protein
LLVLQWNRFIAAEKMVKIPKSTLLDFEKAVVLPQSSFSALKGQVKIFISL